MPGRDRDGRVAELHVAAISAPPRCRWVCLTDVNKRSIRPSMALALADCFAHPGRRRQDEPCTFCVTPLPEPVLVFTKVAIHYRRDPGQYDSLIYLGYTRRVSVRLTRRSTCGYRASGSVTWATSKFQGHG